MIEFLLFGFPAFISSGIYMAWNLKKKRIVSWIKMFFVLLFFLVVNNFIVLETVYIFKGSINIVDTSYQYSDFFLHYLMLSTLIAIICAFIVISWSELKFIYYLGNYKSSGIYFVYQFVQTYIIYVISVIGIALMLFQCTDNSFWGDECYTILTIRHNWYEITFGDPANPPLYYWILKLFVRLFGEYGFVFHVCSAMPYIILIIIGLTYIKKEFGIETAMIFNTFISFAPPAIIYFVEVRMYAWSCLFVFLCFISAFQLLKNSGSGVKSWVTFCIGGVAAAYTHYFALFSVALMYIWVFLYLVKKNTSNKYKCLYAMLISFILYTPWLKVFFTSVIAVSKSFWITGVVPVKECFAFFFSDNRIYYLYLVVIVFTVISFLHLIRIRFENTEIHIEFFGEYKFFDISLEMVLLAFGIVLIISLFQILYGILISPVFIYRYLYPMAAVIWLTFSIVFGKLIYLKIRKVLSLLMVIALMIVYIPNYYKVCRESIQINKETDETLQIIDKLNTEKNVTLISNIDHLNWTVFDYYFPDYHKMVCSFEESWNLDENELIIFFSYCVLENDEVYNNFIEKYDYTSEFRNHSRFAGYDYYLYVITDQKHGN